MNWLTKLERKYGKYAIPNLTLYLIICYAFGYLIQIVNPGFLDYLTLDPYLIFHGQVWRLVTWIVIPPSAISIFTLVMLYFYFSIGTTLERTWGTFRYNVYLLGGMLLTVVGAILLYLVCLLPPISDSLMTAVLGYSDTSVNMIAQVWASVSGMFSTYYVCMSIILAFAATFPDVRILFMFFIPVKIKILGIIYSIMLGVEFLQIVMEAIRADGPISRLMYVGQGTAMLFSMLAFILFFITTRSSFRSPKQIKRQREYAKKVQPMKEHVSKHKCAICGRTEKQFPDLEFRFCSKCNGNYEYCQDHLYTHKHVE
ncbi:MAG: rhomboid family intramembrane serine protease [Lachnospiraceae bacterium]|nr:rhomboid family intramembrane serine protease [Lachnospiraceae bacterium]